jgi:hypothetical protein
MPIAAKRSDSDASFGAISESSFFHNDDDSDIAVGVRCMIPVLDGKGDGHIMAMATPATVICQL